MGYWESSLSFGSGGLGLCHFSASHLARGPENSTARIRNTMARVKGSRERSPLRMVRPPPGEGDGLGLGSPTGRAAAPGLEEALSGGLAPLPEEGSTVGLAAGADAAGAVLLWGFGVEAVPAVTGLGVAVGFGVLVGLGVASGLGVTVGFGVAVGLGVLVGLSLWTGFWTSGLWRWASV